ncbi:hypothetical protein RI367_002703 [Sorochytrium milnesiophthora]
MTSYRSTPNGRHVQGDDDDDKQRLLEEEADEDFASAARAFEATHNSFYDNDDNDNGADDDGSGQQQHNLAGLTQSQLRQRIKRHGESERLAQEMFESDISLRTNAGHRSAIQSWESPVPWRSLVLTLFLFTAGVITLISGFSLLLSRSEKEHRDRWQPLMIIGGMCIVPGAYYLTLFAAAFLKISGYDYSQIPEL